MTRCKSYHLTGHHLGQPGHSTRLKGLMPPLYNNRSCPIPCPNPNLSSIAQRRGSCVGVSYLPGVPSNWHVPVELLRSLKSRHKVWNPTPGGNFGPGAHIPKIISPGRVWLYRPLVVNPSDLGRQNYRTLAPSLLSWFTAGFGEGLQLLVDL